MRYCDIRTTMNIYGTAFDDSMITVGKKYQQDTVGSSKRWQTGCDGFGTLGGASCRWQARYFLLDRTCAPLLRSRTLDREVHPIARLTVHVDNDITRSGASRNGDFNSRWTP
jgi:hypothetical protein